MNVLTVGELKLGFIIIPMLPERHVYPRWTGATLLIIIIIIFIIIKKNYIVKRLLRQQRKREKYKMANLK